MSCHCKPNCTETTPCPCADFTNHGEILVSDDNCKVRRLQGKGLAYSDGDSTQLTDGSERDGLIQLDPPSTPGAAGLMALDKNGNVIKLDKLVEGDTLTVVGGQAIFRSAQDIQNSYDPSKIRDGEGRLAVFVCGPNGTVSLGRYDGCTDGLLGFTEDTSVAPAKTPYCVSWNTIVTRIVELLCANLLVQSDSETAQYSLVCTENGLRKGGTISNITWLSAPLLVAERFYRSPATTGAVGGIVYYPSIIAVVGFFATFSIDLDVTTLEGYNESQTSILFNAHMLTQEGTSARTIVMIINGYEYCRVSSGAYHAGRSVDCSSAQPIIQIPANKIINIKFERQEYSGTPGGFESTLVRLFALGFMH